MTDLGRVSVTLGLNSDEFIKAWSDADDKIQALEKELNKSKSAFKEVSMAMAGTNNPSKELSNTYRKLKDELKQNQKAFDEFNNKIKKLDGGLTQSTGEVNLLRGALGKLAGPAAAALAAKKLFDLGREAVNTAAKFETLAVSFEVLTGGAEAGKKLTDQIIELASKTPLTTEALSDGARTLLSFGESSDAVIEDLKLLGDITGGDAQRMQSLTLAFAQVGSTGRLAGQDLLQMVNAGFNPLAIMSEKTGKSMAQLKDEMSKGLITFNDVKQAMVDATSEGGRFYGMMNKQSETLDGRLSTLSDTWGLVNKEVGDKFLPYIKVVIDKVIELANNIKDPLTLHLGILTDNLKLVGEGLSGVRDFIGHLIPGTNNFSNMLSTMNYNLARTGKLLTYLLTPLKLLKGATFKEVGEEFRKLNAQMRGLQEDYFQSLSGKKPALDFSQQDETIKKYNDQLNKIQNTTKQAKNGFAGLSADKDGADKTEKQQDKALEVYKKYIDDYRKLTQDYSAVLEARQYVEGTLNVDPIKQQQEYDQAIKVYQTYFAKIQEINSSGSKNKAELLKLNEENLARELQEIRVNKELETQRKLNEIAQGYRQQTDQLQFENDMNAGFLGGLFGEGYTKRLELEKWYQSEKQRIIQEGNNNIGLQEEAFANLELLRNQKIAQDNLNTWQQYGSDVSDILRGSFSDIISGNESFSDAMKSLMSDLYQELIKMAMDKAIKEIEIEKWLQTTLFLIKKAFGAIGGLFGSISGGLMSGGSSILSGGGTALTSIDTGIGPIARANTADYLPTYHSGGLVPGTKEQLAVLQGGERVLNRSESSSYASGEESAENGINNIMMFNIKAWDGKDVIQTLKANSQTINQIVNSGIKNNQQGLRSTVQNI